MKVTTTRSPKRLRGSVQRLYKNAIGLPYREDSVHPGSARPPTREISKPMPERECSFAVHSAVVMRALPRSRQGKDAIRTKNGHLLGAVLEQPVAKTATSFALVGAFVDDGVGGGRLDDRFPCPVGTCADVLQSFAEELVRQRRAATIPVDQPFPMRRGKKHVTNVEGGLAERQLENDRVRRQLSDESIDRRDRVAGLDVRRQRRKAGLRVLRRVLIDWDRNGN